MDNIKSNNIWPSVKNVFVLCIFLLLTIFFSSLLNIKKNVDIHYL